MRLNSRNFIKLSALIFSVFFIAVSCKKKGVDVTSYTFDGIGTVLTVIYTGEKSSSLEIDLRSDVKKIEEYFSYYDENSFISELNKVGHERYVEVPDEVCELIEKSVEMNRNTDNFFDITYKSKGKLWEKTEGSVPSQGDLDLLNHLVGVDNILTDCEKSRVKYLKEGVLIDLGGIAKGYAIDRAGRIMKKNGKTNFIINYGGDMLVCGQKGEKPWEIGVKDPDTRGKVLKKISVGKGGCVAIATSGKYERFIVFGNSVYSHIINPGSGMPANESKSVTVVGDNATETDALATAISASNLDEIFIKKIVDKFSVKIYTLSDSQSVWKEYETEK
jgi:FAD:protein FMN transferase